MWSPKKNIQEANALYLKDKVRKSYFILFNIKIRQVTIKTKRILDELKDKHYKIDFKYDDEQNQLRKKIKLENEMIVEKIKDIKDDIDISEHEVQKFY